jgi:hypothetical protein
VTDLSTRDPSPPVGLGVHAVLELVSRDGAAEDLTVDIVPDAAADIDAGLLGVSAPLAQAVLGKRAGSSAAYTAGDLAEVRVRRVTWADEEAARLSAERRQAAQERTAREVAKTAAATFASTFEGKWGGYNPDGMEHWDKFEEESR